MITVDVVIPLRTVPGINAREHHMARHRRVQKEREATALFVASTAAFFAARGHKPARVLFVRISPQLCDTDNLAGAMKHVRDEIAKQFGVSDAPKGGVRWDYDQARGAKGQHAVRITIEALTEPEEGSGRNSICESGKNRPVATVERNL